MTGEATEADFGIPFSTLRTMIQTQQFAGGTKTNTSFLTPLERRLAVRVLPRIPGWLQTNHLTMMTLVWSAMILLFSGMAARDLRWLDGLTNDLSSVCDRSLRWKDWEVSKHRFGTVGLLHGSFA